MIELKLITKKFNTNIVLNKICFQCPDNGLVLIEGENGSGKTTLMNILSFMDEEYQGQYLLDGVDVRSLKEEEKARIRREDISYVFQKNNLVRYLSKDENIHLKDLICNQKTEVGENEDWHKFSQGQQEIIALEKGLKPGKKIYLLDEVTANLDDANQQKTIAAISQLSKESLVIVICHDFNLEDSADYVYQIKKGNINLIKGNLSNILSDKKTKQSITQDKKTCFPKQLFFKRIKSNWFLHFLTIFLCSMTMALGLIGIVSCKTFPLPELLSVTENKTDLVITPNDLVSRQDLLNYFKDDAFATYGGRIVFSKDVPSDGKIYCNTYTMDNYGKGSDTMSRLFEKIGYCIDDSIKSNFFFIYNDDVNSIGKKSCDTSFYLTISRNFWNVDKVSGYQAYRSSGIAGENIYYVNQQFFSRVLHKSVSVNLEDDTFYTSAKALLCSGKTTFDYRSSTNLYQESEESSFNTVFPDGIEVKYYEDIPSNFVLLSDYSMDKIATCVSENKQVTLDLTTNRLGKLLYIYRHYLKVSDTSNTSFLDPYRYYNSLIDSETNRINVYTYSFLIYVMPAITLLLFGLTMVSIKEIQSRDDWILKANGLSIKRIMLMDWLGIFIDYVIIIAGAFGFMFFSLANSGSGSLAISISPFFTVCWFVIILGLLTGLYFLIHFIGEKKHG